MNKKEAFEEINRLQDEYVNELVDYITNPNFSMMKTINFTSPTGTGKTKMMSKLINKKPEYYYIITTLSKGQLHCQIRDSIQRDCNTDNFTVYGSADYRINSKLDAEDIIGKIPNGKQCIWLRDEGHIKTNRFDELLRKVCFKVINFSATNTVNDIQCKFSQTMMLRTVNQETGTPEDAINKLIEVKEAHKKVKGYNPCAIFRCVSGNKSLYNRIISICRKNKLKYIDITDDEYVMAQLCEDDNKYDVIINKFKIVEGIDIRRAHVIYMDNQPSNNVTTIQLIGRCRRNALLYRDDIDILDDKNIDLLNKTRECYVFYNVENMKISTDVDGELQYAFCNYISCEELKEGTSIEVFDGQLSNGLYVIELAGKTGKYNIINDTETGFNIVEPLTDFYDTKIENVDNNYLYTNRSKIRICDVSKLPQNNKRLVQDDISKKLVYESVEPFYTLDNSYSERNLTHTIPEEVRCYFSNKKNKYSRDYILTMICDKCFDLLHLDNYLYDIKEFQNEIDEYISKRGNKRFGEALSLIRHYKVTIYGIAYNLSEICSDTEITILQHFCIKNRASIEYNGSVWAYASNYIKLRNQYYILKYEDEISVGKFFRNVRFEDYSLNEIENYISDFVDNKQDEPGYQGRCNMISALESGGMFDKLRNVCSYIEMDMIKFAYLKECEIGLEIDEFFLKIDEFVKNRHRFILKLQGADAEKIGYILLNDEIENISLDIYEPVFELNVHHHDLIDVNANSIDVFFSSLNKYLTNIKEKSKTLYLDSNHIISQIENTLARIEENLNNNIIEYVHYDYSDLFEELTPADNYLLNKDFIRKTYKISQKELINIETSEPYVKYTNDKESAVIGVDLMRQIKTENDDVVWIESKAVSSKIISYNKFNIFIANKYADELKKAETLYIHGKNNFELDTRCNSMIGYCVEYYSKYLVYGHSYMDNFIKEAQHEIWEYDTINDYIIIRACMLKYKEMMVRVFGLGIAKVITGISINMLQKEKYSYFVNLISELGKKTATYVKETLYAGREAKNNIDANLSIDHIAGLADYITEDTILDIKVRNNIDERCVRQVLAYHYLSTKRSDLNIKKVIVYDAVSGKSLTLDISEKNLKK